MDNSKIKCDRICILCLKLYEHEKCSDLKVTFLVLSLRLNFFLVLFFKQYTAIKFIIFKNVLKNQHEGPHVFSSSFQFNIMNQSL